MKAAPILLEQASSLSDPLRSCRLSACTGIIYPFLAKVKRTVALGIL